VQGKIPSDLPLAFRQFFSQSREPSPSKVPALKSSATAVAFPSQLTQPLPFPPAPANGELTRSEQFFSSATSIDVRALKIASDAEFHLFMDLRAEHKWVTYSMTSTRWIRATNDYNARLQESGIQDVILKNPRALMDKLAEVEPIIADRILKNDYIGM
jgi:hypothetical protein